MAPVPSPGYLDRFRDALISEIKAELGRRDLTSAGLAKLIGESKQYVSSRLGPGNPHTGKRVEINIPDLYVIAGALELEPSDLLRRAAVIAGEEQELAGSTGIPTLAEERAKRRPATPRTNAARKQPKPRPGE